jgi:hypothetical protein
LWATKIPLVGHMRPSGPHAWDPFVDAQGLGQDPEPLNWIKLLVVSCFVKCILTYENIQHSNQPSFYYSHLRGQKQTTSGKNDFDSHSKISCHSKLVTLHLYTSRCHDTGWMLYISFFEFWINFPKKTGRQYYKQNFVLKSLNWS